MGRKKAIPETTESMIVSDPVTILDAVLVEKATETGTPPEPTVPGLNDLGWSDYVISQLDASEKDDKGNPFVHGLRRITRVLIGPIIQSESRVVQSPRYVQGRNDFEPAVVEHRLVILNTTESTALEQVFTECADAHRWNIDPKFGKYPTAIASTRAEARAYRKALCLKAVAAEELTEVAEPEVVDSLITGSQKTLISIMCSRAQVDAQKFLQYSNYNNIELLTESQAKVLLDTLSGWVTEPEKVPAELKSSLSNQ